MPLTLSKSRPRQGARLAELRKAAHLSQAALAIGESQQNVWYWEQSDKPPRPDGLPKLAHIRVSVEHLVDVRTPVVRRSDRVGTVRKVFEDVSELARRRQQDRRR